MKIKLSESFVKPYTGIFWYINDNVVGLVENVDKHADCSTPTTEHYQLWNKIKNDYKVNNELVDYDYFPRGRVYVSAMINLDGEFDGYLNTVRLDPCLNSTKCKDKIANYYNLYSSSSWTEPIFIFNDEHYKCNDCK